MMMMMMMVIMMIMMIVTDALVWEQSRQQNISALVGKSNRERRNLPICNLRQILR
jgi:hypothetical protein